MVSGIVRLIMGLSKDLKWWSSIDGCGEFANVNRSPGLDVPIQLYYVLDRRLQWRCGVILDFRFGWPQCQPETTCHVCPEKSCKHKSEETAVLSGYTLYYGLTLISRHFSINAAHILSIIFINILLRILSCYLVKKKQKTKNLGKSVIEKYIIL